MIYPCKRCERQGCGEYHGECEAYREWTEENRKQKEWMDGLKPVTSEQGLKARNEKLRHGTSRKWNLKQRYNKD